MYHNALIIEDDPQQTALEKVIELILASSATNSFYSHLIKNKTLTLE